MVRCAPPPGAGPLRRLVCRRAGLAVALGVGWAFPRPAPPAARCCASRSRALAEGVFAPTTSISALNPPFRWMAGVAFRAVGAEPIRTRASARCRGSAPGTEMRRTHSVIDNRLLGFFVDGALRRSTWWAAPRLRRTVGIRWNLESGWHHPLRARKRRRSRACPGVRRCPDGVD